MPYDRIQHKSAFTTENASSIDVSLDNVPAVGNLLILNFAARFSTTPTLPSGWTVAWNINTNSFRHTCAYRIVGENEPQTITVASSVARPLVLLVEERFVATAISNIISVDGSAATGTSLSTGFTSALAEEPQYGIAMFAADGDVFGTPSFSNGFSVGLQVGQNAPYRPFIVTGEKELTELEAVETTLTISSEQKLIGGLFTIIPAGIPPLVAGSLSSIARRADYVSLEWTDSIGGTSPRTAQLQVSLAGTDDWVDEDDATASPATVSGLTIDTAYDFRVRYEDSASEVTYSNTVTVTTSNKPIVVIEDVNGSTDGVFSVMGPGQASFHLTGSELGAGTWLNAKVEWDFGNPSGRHNQVRGFSAGHFYDYTPESNTDYTVTATITNIDGESSQATRTVRVTPNTRTQVYIDPDAGSSTPSNPSSIADPYDTIANAWAGTAGSNIEFILTAGKSHAWTVPLDGDGARSNIYVRSSVLGVKAIVEDTPHFLIGRANNHGIRDLTIVSGTIERSRMLDARYTQASPCTGCWIVDVDSTYLDMSVIVSSKTGGKGHLMLGVSANSGATQTWTVDVNGDMLSILSCDLSNTFNTRVYRGGGDHLLIANTSAVCDHTEDKAVFTREGGSWLYVSDSSLTNRNTATNTPLHLGHTTSGESTNTKYSVFERCLFEQVDGNTRPVVNVGPNKHGADSFVFRNCIFTGGHIEIRTETVDEGELVSNGLFVNNTLICNTSPCIRLSGSKSVDNSLLANVVIPSASAWVLLTDSQAIGSSVVDNLSGSVTSPVRFDGINESWETFNARDIASGNKSIAITLDEEYRPSDMTDTDLVVTMPLDMINFQEDYYGNPRSTDKWHVGAVSLDHIQPEDPDLPSKPMAYERVQYKGKNQNRISDLDYITVTLDHKPIEGNLLLLYFGSRYGTTITLPDGWTEVWRQSDSVISCCAYKIAGNDESQDVTVNISTIRDIVLVVEERYPPESIDRVVVNSTEGVGVNQLSTGPTDVLSTSPQHAIAVVTVQDGSRGGEEFSDGFVETIRQETSDPGSTIQPFIIIAEKELNSTDPVETTISITNNRLMIVGLLTIIPGDIPEHTPGTLSRKTRRGDSITVQWTDSVGGVAPRTSQLQISPTGQNSWVDVENAISSPSTVANLSDDTTYDFRVKYNDANDNIVYSNIISETTSNKPIAIIEDDQYNTEGVIERMGPCMIGFLMTDSEFGAGDSSNIKPEWDFGDSGSRYNELRGFSAAHFYDIDESYDVEKTVTLKLTNADQEQDIATRTVRIKANTRTKIYIDPDLGSPSPTDPSDPNDPFDTPANAWNGTSGSDLEFILTAGKTHIWDTAFNGSGSRHNILVRSSIKGVKANVSVTSGFVIGGANQHGIRDIHFVTGGRQEWFRMLDARYTSLNKSSFCWVLDCTSEDAMCAVGITSDDSYFTLFQNVQSDDKTNINSLWGGGKGTIILGCNIRHGDGTLNVERPIRAKGDNILVHDTTCIANTYKSAFTRNGGRWLWISGCRFIQENAGVALGLTHNHEDIEGRVENVVVEKTLIKSYGTDGSHASIALAGSNQSAREVVVRNCIIDGGIIHAKMDFDEGQLLEDIRFYNLTIIHEKPDIQPITFIEPLHRNTKVSGCLAIASLVNSWSIRMMCDPDLVLQNPYIHQNVMPIAQEDGDIYTGSLESWSTWNQRNPNYGTGNLSKNIILDELYRSVEDTDLIVDMPTDMINFQEDYYGSKRDPDNWVAGAVSFFPILESDMYVGSQQVVRLYVGSQEVQTVY